jgi:RNA polymerase sigma factor (sigma-70 family)
MWGVAADAEIEELLRHADWLRRLAANLVGDGAEIADDLVQDTWVAALRHPPAPGVPARAWLAQVLRNFLKMRFRAAAVRRARRAEVAATAGPAAPAAADVLLDRLHAQRVLSRIVAELDEPFRETVLLRYYEGLNASEIARLRGIPAGTVRWRLKAAIDRIRSALDVELGDRPRWRRALVPLVCYLRRPPPPSPWPAARVLGLAAAVWIALLGAWREPSDVADEPTAAPVPPTAHALDAGVPGPPVREANIS